MNSSVTILLAPSKTMDFLASPPYAVDISKPVFNDQAAQITAAIGRLSIKKLMQLMHVSQPIAKQVAEWAGVWDETRSGCPALWAYAGDVYKGVKAKQLSVGDADWAENHLLILSGLYGLLRPYDGIQPYRLEMQAKITIQKKSSMYEIWGSRLAEFVVSRNSAWICNLSSNEYARAVLKHLKSSEDVVTPTFFDQKPSGVVAQVPIYSKMMRGVMAHWMIIEHVDDQQRLNEFAEHGYAYDEERSRPGFPAFFRSVMKPLVI